MTHFYRMGKKLVKKQNLEVVRIIKEYPEYCLWGADWEERLFTEITGSNTSFRNDFYFGYASDVNVENKSEIAGFQHDIEHELGLAVFDYQDVILSAKQEQTCRRETEELQLQLANELDQVTVHHLDGVSETR